MTDKKWFEVTGGTDEQNRFAEEVLHKELDKYKDIICKEIANSIAYGREPRGLGELILKGGS